MRRKLTRAVYDGLASLASVVEAGAFDDIIGYSEDQMEKMPEERKEWENILRAVDWIKGLEPPKR